MAAVQKDGCIRRQENGTGYYIVLFVEMNGAGRDLAGVVQTFLNDLIIGGVGCTIIGNAKCVHPDISLSKNGFVLIVKLHPTAMCKIRPECGEVFVHGGRQLGGIQRGILAADPG